MCSPCWPQILHIISQREAQSSRGNATPDAGAGEVAQHASEAHSKRNMRSLFISGKNASQKKKTTKKRRYLRVGAHSFARFSLQYENTVITEISNKFHPNFTNVYHNFIFFKIHYFVSLNFQTNFTEISLLFTTISFFLIHYLSRKFY